METVLELCKTHIAKFPELKTPGNVVAPGPLDNYRGRKKNKNAH